MRLTTMVLSVALIHISTTAHTQITLKEKNAPLEKVLTNIERQTKFVFLYDPDDVKTVRISINIKNLTLQEALRNIFKGIPIEFTVVGNNVLLKKNHVENAVAIADFSVHGRVVDLAGHPLPGATVINKRDRKGTQTDSIGVFTLRGVKGDVLQFSFVGYKDEEIVIGDRPFINISLQINASSADQVVVIGYGSIKKKDLTGSISIVDLQGKGEIPFHTVDNLLAGKAAGVQVIKTDGAPGGMVRIRIRGSTSLLGGNDPLYVIDGVPVQVRNNFIDPGFRVGSPVGNLTGANLSTARGAALSASFVNSLNSLGGVNPADIDSITVLKDASSTAIYGSKAANGVVIITTKTGKTGAPARVAVDYSITVNSLYRPPRLLNSSQYKILLTEAAKNCMVTANLGGTGTYPYVKAIVNDPAYFGSANTDWIGQVTHTTIENNVGLSVSGGGPSARYFTSFTYNKSPGVLNGTGNQRITGKLSLVTAITSKFSITSNLLVGFTDQAISVGSYMQAQLARPDWSPRDSTGNYTGFDHVGHGYEGFLNPAALLTATNNAKTLSLLGSLSGTYDIAKKIHFKTAVSLNVQHYNQRNYLPSYINLQGGFFAEPNPGGIGSVANSRFADWFLENTLSYDQQFEGKHAWNILLGQSYETTKYSFFRATATGFSNDNFLNGLSSATTPLSVAGDEPRSPQSYLLSFYARMNYSYKDKYLLTFTGRTDGSSKFGPDNKFGYFPSGAVAWRLSREDFLKTVGWINDVKLRGSYGLTGTQNIGDKMYLTLYNNISYNGAGAAIPVQLGNSGIKWETTRQATVGLDLSLLKNRLYATVDYYSKRTGGALLTLPVAPSSSYDNLLQNAVGLRSSGWELAIGGDLIRTKDFKWTASVNATWNTSLVTKIDTTADFSQLVSPSGLESVISIGNNSSTTSIAPGRPLGTISGQIISGIIHTQAQLDQYNQQLGTSANNPVRQIGNAMYRLDPTTAAQGYQDKAYNQVLGNGPPKVYGGITQEFSYKNIGLQCYFTFSQGGHLLWAEHVASTAFLTTANAGVSMLDRYTPAHTQTGQPMLDLTDNYTPTNLDVFSSSYLKLRSLTLNYQLRNIQLFLSATNVFTITKYPGSDPETSDDPYFVGGGYIDAGNYPAVKTFTLGFKVILK